MVPAICLTNRVMSFDGVTFYVFDIGQFRSIYKTGVVGVCGFSG